MGGFVLGQQGRYVLIVEDDKDIRESLAQLLEDYGYESRMASNGSEALEMLAGAPPPRLILLDLMMPVMDGTEFARTASGRPELAGVPICLVTATARLPDGLPGVVSMLRKPMDPIALIEIVQRYCDG